jgi:hypothetical protein
VKSFEPYESTKELNEPARAAGRKLIAAAKSLDAPSFIFVNNRLEGNAPTTIAAMLEEPEGTAHPKLP